ncbi:MAG: M48 family metalloprotease [Acidobacteriota bacterium]
MFEWLAGYYLQLILNLKILLTNPSACYAVGYLRLFSLTLLALLSLKVLLHVAAVRWLRRSFSTYPERQDSKLMQVYRQAAREARVSRRPALYRFANRRPLAFTVGVFRPAVFVAPCLVEQLPDAELRATLVHELGHIRRRDNLRVWLQELFLALIPALVVQCFANHFIFSGSNSDLAIGGAVAGLLIFRLALWRPLRWLRERSCDDLTVEVIQDPLTLASSLIRVWRLGRSLPPQRWGWSLPTAQPFLRHHSPLQGRIRRLLNYRPPRLKRLLARLFIAMGTVWLVFVVAFLLRFHLSEQSRLVRPASVQPCPGAALLLK